MKNAVIVSLAAIGLTSLVTSVTSAVPTGASGYDRTYIGVVPGSTSAPTGGMAFLPSDPNTLLIGTPGASGTINAYTVTRNAQNHVTGITGSPTLFANAPSLSATGLSFGPGGVLFYSAGTSIGQIKPGSTTADKTINLASISGYFFDENAVVSAITTPPNASTTANVIVRYASTSSNFYEATFTPDGTGTYNISSPTYDQFVGNIADYDPVPTSLVGNGVPQVYVAQRADGNGRASLDANNHPTNFLGLDSITSNAGVVDPLTGDYIISHTGVGSIDPGLHVISPIPEPATAALLVGLAGAGCMTRCRRLA